MDAKRDTPKGLMTMKRTLFIFALAFSFLSLSSLSARPQSDAGARPKTPAQITFPTPEAAVDAMIKGLEDYDVPELLKIFGPSGEDFISSADPVRDKNVAINFGRMAREKHSLQINPSKPNRAILVVGNEEFPFPVPLVKTGGKWLFDTAAGRKEILYRRIGANELDAIQVCRGYVEAQRDYASTIHDNSGVNQYAQRLISTPGKQDGLYWQNADGTPGGWVSERVAKALAEGYTLEKDTAYHGYYFKVLKGQGPAAPLGKLNYLIQDAMIGGFALIATPAEYRVTGVKTFIVGPQGIVYQKDLGPDSLKIAKDIELYNPDKTWHETDDQWPDASADIQVATGK
jgi:hypothetical protein